MEEKGHAGAPEWCMGEHSVAQVEVTGRGECRWGGGGCTASMWRGCASWTHGDIKAAVGSHAVLREEGGVRCCIVTQSVTASWWGHSQLLWQIGVSMGVQCRWLAGGLVGQ